MNSDKPKLYEPPPAVDKRRTTELRIPLSKTERGLLDRAAGAENTSTWARMALLLAAKP